MMRVGFLYDFLGVPGGAELNLHAYQHAAPAGVEVVDCPPGRPLPDCDVYVVSNCLMYHAWITDAFKGKRVVKVVNDVWALADERLRAWLLDNAVPVLVSPYLYEVVPWRFKQEPRYVPSVIDLARFRAAANGTARSGAVWLGRAFASKGLDEARAWALQNGMDIDFYGDGPDKPADWKGVVSQAELPQTLARYDWFVFLPREPDPCPRTVIEAWAAGCKLALNGMQGASWWIENDPDALENAAARFWEVVLA
jgi:hypothetical protein